MGHRPWLRRAVIAGDVTGLGVQLGLITLAALPFIGLRGLWQGDIRAIGVAMLSVCGFALAWWGRRNWQALLAEVIEAHRQDDPGPSPVAWISEGLWRQKNAFDPALDAPLLLRAEVEPLIKPYGRDALGALREPVLRVVRDEERKRAPRVSPQGTAYEVAPSLALDVLRGTPGRFLALGAQWPYCCGALSTLVALRESEGPAEALDLPAEDGSTSAKGRGLHGFVCEKCGASYRTEPIAFP